MLNELEGAGLLGLPYAMRLSGYWALGCMALAGSMASWTGWALAECMYDERGQRVRTKYDEVGRDTYGERGQRLVLLVQMCNLVAVGVVYLVLIGSTMHAVHPIVSNTELPWLSHADQRLWTLVAVLFVLPTVHIGGYRKLALLSALGIGCLMAIIVVGLACSARVISDNGGVAAVPELDWHHLPAVFSMFVFAFSAHGIFPDLKASMRDPELFSNVIGVVFAVNVALKILFTTACFFAWGGDTQAVVSANFSHGERLVVSILIAANTWLSFPLPLIPVFRNLKSGLESRGWVITATREALIRTVVVLCCGAVAFSIPNFAVAMGFMGSITLSFLTFIFPATFYLKLHYDRCGALTVFWAGLVIIVGVVGGIAGVVSTAALASKPPA